MYAITDNNQHPQAVRKGQTSHPPNPDAPRPKQGRSSEADPRFTFHASRFTVPGSDARTKLAGFFRIVLKIPTAFDRLEQRHFVGILDIHPDWNSIGDTRDPGPERFQLVR